MPLVSVIMPVYNGGKYLNEAIQSVLNQTFQDFELIIFDDGSTDNTVEIAKSFNNEKIKLFINPLNEKQGKARNKCIEYSSGKYLANLDSDDIAEPGRLERQVEFMDNNPEVGVCGSFAKIIGEETIRKFETDDSKIKFKMLFDSPFLNSSVIIRKSVLEKFNIRYNQNSDYARDYELWTELSVFCMFANLPEVLVNYRIHPDSVTEKFRDLQQKDADLIRLKQVHNIGISVSEEEEKLYLEIIKSGFKPLTANRAIFLHNWIRKLSDAKFNVIFYDKKIFKDFFIQYWVKYVNNYNFSDYKPLLLKTVHTSPFKKHYSLKFSQKLKFAFKCFIYWKTGKSDDGVIG
jgi:glycosyltransferase involved in cell wall biosynthesis